MHKGGQKLENRIRWSSRIEEQLANPSFGSIIINA